jgi:hypothetical protein
MGMYSSNGKYSTNCDSSEEEDDPECWRIGESQELQPGEGSFNFFLFTGNSKHLRIHDYFF